MKISIDGKSYEAHQGQTVLEIAKENGIYIPTLCYYKKTGKVAKCRACVVDIEGMQDLRTSCTTEVRDGMKVTLKSEKVMTAQRLVVDLMLSSGDHDCLTCEASSECELQQAAYYLGIEHSSYRTCEDAPKDESSEFITRDSAKCIKCGRCVVGCNDKVVNNVLDFGYRSSESRIICDADVPMGESNCVQCGECVQLCPTGALVDKKSIGKGRPWDLKKVDTICPYCGVGCNITLHINESANKIVKVTGIEDAITNKGMLCVKGRYGMDFVASNERLTTPLIRDEKGGEFREASWEEATTLVANKFLNIKKVYGSKTIAGLASAKVTNEENFAFQKFIRKEVGTNNVDHCARL